MANFSKFIRPGSRIIFTDDDHSVAAYDEAEKQLTIVVRNEGGNKKEVNYDLTAFNFDNRTAKVYQTSEFANLAESELPIYSNGLKSTLELKSVTTIVVSNIEINK
jgi:hypothetical protein